MFIRLTKISYKHMITIKDAADYQHLSLPVINYYGDDLQYKVND
jgi:hypothetical protein